MTEHASVPGGLEEVVPTLQVNDMNLASYLYARGYEIISLKSDRSDLDVVFKDVPRGEVYTYVNGSARIEPRPLLEAFRAIRSLTRTVSSYRGGPTTAPQNHRVTPTPVVPKAPALAV